MIYEYNVKDDNLKYFPKLLHKIYKYSNVLLDCSNIWIRIMSSEKKELILSAARECFTKFGYKKTTLEDIGKKMGLNKASLYHYFKSKEDIFTTILLNEYQQFYTKLHENIKQNMDCEQKILIYFKQKLQYFQKSTILQQITEINPEVLQHIISSGKQIIQEIDQKEKEFLENILKQCIQKGQIKECNVEKVSVFLIGLVNGIKHSYEWDLNNLPSAADFDQIIQDVQSALKIFLQGLK